MLSLLLEFKVISQCIIRYIVLFSEIVLEIPGEAHEDGE